VIPRVKNEILSNKFFLMKCFVCISLVLFLAAFQDSTVKKISFCEALKQFKASGYNLKTFNSGHVTSRDSLGNVLYQLNIDVLELSGEVLYNRVDAKGNILEANFHGDMQPRSKGDMERYFSEVINNIESCGFKINTSNNVRYIINLGDSTHTVSLVKYSNLIEVTFQ
jgi:hypothetical protein